MGRPKKTVEQICFATPSIQSKTPTYGIRSIDEAGVVGWFVDEKLQVKTFPTPEKAEKAKKEMMKDTHYSWNCKVEVALFNGFEREDLGK